MKARGKQFLNESFNESGYIKWEILAGKDAPYHSDLVRGTIVIADCNSTISLDFDVEEVAHFDKRINKLDVLIVELQKAKEALHNAKEQHEKRNKFYY